MKQRFRLYRRNGGIFYVHDGDTGKQESLCTRDRAEASALFAAKTQSHRQAHLNLRLARTYLAATDPMVSKRTWQVPMEELARTKHGATHERWLRALKDKAFDLIRDLPILETQAEHFLKVLYVGTVSTNVFLRRIHNFALDMGWLPWPVVVKRQWPAIEFKDKRAITSEEHHTIIALENNLERKAFYKLCWHLGGSQSDIVNLQADNIDWETKVVGFSRLKTKSVAMIHFGEEVEKILKSLPSQGALFPNFRKLNAGHRATEFQRMCRRAKVSGVTLHSYRYAWAERAKVCGYPERFAQEALGHNSKAIHRAYARKAKVKLPSLEAYEKRAVETDIIPLAFQRGMATDLEALSLQA
jgi:integrase